MDNTVLIVDDEAINVEILRRLLQKDYTLATAHCGSECLKLIDTVNPGVVLLDIMMPGIDGYEVCRRIKQSPRGPSTQVVLVSAKGTTRERLAGYEVGADDYVIKPFDHDELVAKVKIQFRLRDTLVQLEKANDQLQCHNDGLEKLVEARTAEIVATRDITVFALAKLAESRDPETGLHLERIRSYCRVLADQLSMSGPYRDVVDEAFVEDIYRSSPLHDIGKVGIPDAILLKPSRLTDSEFEIMKRHTSIGAKALASTATHSSSGSFLEMAVAVAQHHHERYDGGGYPAGLRRDDIPLPARITAVADVFDALTSTRVYKDAFSSEVARSMIEAESEKDFDPAVVAAFVERFDDFCQIRNEFAHPDHLIVSAA